MLNAAARLATYGCRPATGWNAWAVTASATTASGSTRTVDLRPVEKREVELVDYH
jgi:hypothetical protein